MKIFIGLGNPGPEYEDTRHNVGFRVIDELRKRHEPFDGVKTEYCRGWMSRMAGKEVLLVKPKTFINQSGIAVKKLFDRYGGDLEDYVIIHDDLDIEVGRIKIISKKGPGGHNGIISIVSILDSRDFVRVRIGIGREKAGNSYVDYVLAPFTREETPCVEKSVWTAASACEEMVRSSTAKAMSLYNSEKSKPGDRSERPGD